MPYVKPGVYIRQKYVPTSSTPGVFLIPCIIGKGLEDKRVWGEEIVRGQIRETITVDPNTGAFTISGGQSDQLNQHTTLIRDGVDLGHDAVTWTSATGGNVKMEYVIAGSVYEIVYLAIDTTSDKLNNNANRVHFVASTPDGSSQYERGVDYSWSESTPDEIDWSILQEAKIIGNAETYDLSANDTVKISVDGKTPIEVTIVGATQSAVTAAEVATAINGAAQTAWGSAYSNIAVDNAGTIELHSVQKGLNGRINLYVPSANDATQIIFNVTAPSYATGTGQMPALGESYYVRYDYDRDDVEYNNMTLYYSYSDALDALGPMKPGNDLLIAVESAFQNGAPIVGVIQVKDADGDGLYMDSDWFTAIDELDNAREVTDVVLLSHDQEVKAYLVRKIEDRASQLVGHHMAGWFGMPANSNIGNIDTPDTAIYVSQKTLQVSAQSQGRGRYINVFVLTTGDYDFSGINKEIVDTDSRVTFTVTLGTEYVAAALAGLQASFNPISESLLRRSIVGFDTSNIIEHDTKASYATANGVFVLQNIGGRLVVFDPVTTDTGGDEVFSEPSVRVQKDYLAGRIKNRLDQYVVSVVPDNLDDFLFEIKYHIAIEINAAIVGRAIAPYTDDNNVARPLDLVSDIKVYKFPTSNTEYGFVYWFQPRWVSKKIFGEYVVAQPLM